MQDPNTQPSVDTPTPAETSPTPAAAPVVPPIPAPAAPEASTFAATPAPTVGTETQGAQGVPGTQPQAPDAKNHLVAVLLSIFVGGLGVDRFYLGHIGLGVAKLLLSWVTFGIWWLIDVILVATRKVKNVTWEN